MSNNNRSVRNSRSTRNARGSAARWILIVVLLIVIGFGAGFLYSRYGGSFSSSGVKPGYLSNLDSIYLNSISGDLELTATQKEVVQLAIKSEFSERVALTQQGLADNAISSQLKSTTASAVEIITSALGDKTDKFIGLVKEYNQSRSIPLALTQVKVYYIVADPDWGVKAENHYVVDENKPLRALEALIQGPTDLSMGMPLPPTTRILGFNVENGTAYVDLSKEAITEAYKYCPVSAGGEAMSIYAIGNTLTEFPDIKTVKLSIEGKTKGEIDGYAIESYWGHFGLPSEITRNEKAIIP
ncbi:GerMN domain-containing protein [Coprothermobacter platensis]|uniref:GerMN domain-containing protein n=1 Tax=Coprothermobacter platensis TaxID=108819 RepID=UPI00036F797E|nr:GerMN domain-containing protein [Coprothermobacter platensis]